MNQDSEDFKPLDGLHAAARASVAEALRTAARKGHREHLYAARAVQTRFLSASWDAPQLERIRGEADWLVLAAQLDT